MKTASALTRCAFLVAGVQALSAVAQSTEPSQFISRVYFLIHEATPYQLQRSRKMIEREFAKTIESVPQLQGARYQVVSDGNEVVFSMVSTVNMQLPFQAAVSDMVAGSLNGQVRTRGRYDFLRTSMDTPSENYLEVVLDKTGTRIRSLIARSITFRDLLSELQLQFSEAPSKVRGIPVGGPEVPRFSYMVPGDCAAKQVDWHFGNPDQPEQGKEEPSITLEEAMTKLAALFKLRVQNHHGTYIFSGECPRPLQARKGVPAAMEFLPTRWIPLGEGSFSPPLMARPLPVVPVNISE